jgi:putative FmdB family regulatory protein
MPIYEYHCVTCDERFEELVRGPDAPVECSCCGGAEVERLISVFAGVGGTAAASQPDYSRLAQRPAGGGCCGGACGHRH